MAGKFAKPAADLHSSGAFKGVVSSMSSERPAPDDRPKELATGKRFLPVAEVGFVKPLKWGGGASVIRPGEGSWVTWKVQSDISAREVVVEIPNATKSRRYRIPFENVEYYEVAE